MGVRQYIRYRSVITASGYASGMNRGTDQVITPSVELGEGDFGANPNRLEAALGSSHRLRRETYIHINSYTYIGPADCNHCNCNHYNCDHKSFQHPCLHLLKWPDSLTARSYSRRNCS